MQLHEMLLVEVGATENSEFIIQNSELSLEEIKELVELLSRAHGELKYAVLPQLPLEMSIVEWGIQKTQNTKKVRESDDPKVRLSNSPSFPSVPKDNFWQELIDKVKSYNHSIAGVLRGCSVKSYNNESLIIETSFKFHKDRLDDENARLIIEKVCQDIAGKPVDVSIIMKGGV